MEKERRDLVSLCADKPRPINSNWLWHTCGLLNDWFLIDFSLVLFSLPLQCCQGKSSLSRLIGQVYCSCLWHFKPEYAPSLPNILTRLMLYGPALPHYFTFCGAEKEWNVYAVPWLHLAAFCYQNEVWQQILTSYHPSQSVWDRTTVRC